MASFPQNIGGRSDETSRIFCGHVNFPAMNVGLVYMGGTKLNNYKEGGLVITNNTLQKIISNNFVI